MTEEMEPRVCRLRATIGRLLPLKEAIYFRCHFGRACRSTGFRPLRGSRTFVLTAAVAAAKVLPNAMATNALTDRTPPPGGSLLARLWKKAAGRVWIARELVTVLVREPQQAAYVGRWYRSIYRHPMTDRMASVTFGALTWLERHLTRDMRVFEYGAGGSTLFLAARAGSVISIEHNPEWHRRVTQALRADERDHCECRLVEHAQTAAPDVGSAPVSYYSQRFPTSTGDFELYVKTIDGYPDDWFDLVLVDGRARMACVWHARQKIKPGGYLMLDDAERPEYLPAGDMLAGWQRTDFYGLGPFGRLPWQTTIWRRPT